MKMRTAFIGIGVACGLSIVAAGCSTSSTGSDSAATMAASKSPSCSYLGQPYSEPVYPSQLLAPTNDLKFPANPSSSGQALTAADYHPAPYKIKGYTSFFGAVSSSGGYDSPGGFALPQAWNNSASQPPADDFAEGGLTYPLTDFDPGPCNDNPDYTPKPYSGGTDTGNFRSYYAAVRVTPKADEGLDYSTGGYQQLGEANANVLDDWYDSAVGTKDPIYGKMYLYGRNVLVSRSFTDSQGQPVTKQVIVRLTDRGPVESDPYWQRAIDLSPWAMGALNEDPACLDFNGATPSSACDISGPGSWTKPDWQVTACWAADYKARPGPVTSSTPAKCLGE